MMHNLIKSIFNVKTKGDYFKKVNKTFWTTIGWYMARSTRNLAILATFGVVSYISAISYNYLHPNVVEAEPIVKTITVEATSTPPVLQRIMNCESQKSQLAKNGQINYHINTDGSLDIGIMEINSVNFIQATKLGYDLTKESDNIAFGRWLYANRGTEPWYSSKSCWNK